MAFCTQFHDWLSQYKDDWESVEIDRKSGRPKMSTIDKNIKKDLQVSQEDL